MDFPRKFQYERGNPYGIVGLTYDCETHLLYTSSLAGSNPNRDLGCLYVIDIGKEKITAQKCGFDVLGLGIFVTGQEKRLYLGSARSPKIYSIALDASGRMTGRRKYELSLSDARGGGFDCAHRIRFLSNNSMEIKGIEFSYSLIAASDPLRNVYLYRYNPVAEAWQFVEVKKQSYR